MKSNIFTDFGNLSVSEHLFKNIMFPEKRSNFIMPLLICKINFRTIVIINHEIGFYHIWDCTIHWTSTRSSDQGNEAIKAIYLSEFKKN